MWALNVFKEQFNVVVTVLVFFFLWPSNVSVLQGFYLLYQLSMMEGYLKGLILKGKIWSHPGTNALKTSAVKHDYRSTFAC